MAVFTIGSKTLSGSPTGGAVGGASNLTTVGAIPYVSASGVLNQDAKISWNATNGTFSVTGVAGKDAPAISVTKGVGSASAIDVVVDSSGYATRWFTPSFSSGTNPSAFISDSGGFSTRASILVSNNTSGTGLSFNILAPTSDASMIQAWSDVNGPTMQLRSTDAASDGNSRHLDMIDHSGNYRIVFEELGYIRFSTTTRAAADLGIQRYSSAIDGNSVLNVTNGAYAPSASSQGALRAAAIYLGTADARILSQMDVRGDFAFKWSSVSDDYKSTKDLGLARNAAGVLEIDSGTAGQYRDLILRRSQHSGVTVLALPAAAAGNAGSIQYVTDASATTIGSVVAGGGSNKVMVWSDGTNWKIYAS